MLGEHRFCWNACTTTETNKIFQFFVKKCRYSGLSSEKAGDEKTQRWGSVGENEAGKTSPWGWTREDEKPGDEKNPRWGWDGEVGDGESSPWCWTGEDKGG